MNEQGKPMSRQEKAIQDLMRICLGIQKEEQAVDHMLAQLGKYYAADRCCIFEVNEEEVSAIPGSGARKGAPPKGETGRTSRWMG